MFFCCCPQQKPIQLKQTLIQSIPQQLNKSSSITQPQKKQQIKINSIGTKPQFDNNELEECQIDIYGNYVIGKKSDLWQIQDQSEIIYCNHQTGKQTFLSFIINKKSINKISNVIQYVKKKSDKNLSLVVPYCIIRFFKENNCIFFQHNTQQQFKAPFFTNIAVLSLDTKITRKLSAVGWGRYQEKFGQIIQLENLNQVRIRQFDNIFLCFSSEVNEQRVKQLCINYTRQFQFEQLCKITYLFPYFMNIRSIADIIFGRLRRFVMRENIENIIHALTYQIDFIDQCKPPVIIVRRRFKLSKQSNFVNFGIGLLMFQMFDQSNTRIYRNLIENIKRRKLKQYIALKSSLDRSRNNRDQFRNILDQLKFINNQDLSIIYRQYHNLKQIIPTQYQNCNETGFIIKPNMKEKVGKIIQGYDDTENTPVKKQWDDDLKSWDFKVPNRKQNYQTFKTFDIDQILDDTINGTKLQLSIHSSAGYQSDDQPQFQLRQV